MIVSLNELEFTVRKAVRGAGYHWGEAEEAGKAAVWLARRGLPVAEPLLAVLRAAGRDPAALRPVPGGHRASAAGPLCPLLAGIMIADGVVALEAGTRLTLERLLSPLLLLPFMALAAGTTGQALVLDWPEGSATVTASAAWADWTSVPSEGSAATLGVAPAPAQNGTPRPESHRVLDVDSAAWDALNAFAAETYVPATDRSRLAGAGAGLADND